MEFVLVLVLVALVVIVGVVCGVIHEANKVNSISFMETFNLTELPIVTFFAGNTKVNFLLDTGSSNSFIASDFSDFINGSEVIDCMDLTSATGTEQVTCRVIDTVLTYKDKDYDITLWVNEGLSSAFADLKNSKGIILHGILGSDFLSRHSYVLDFKKYTAYSKK